MKPFTAEQKIREKEIMSKATKAGGWTYDQLIEWGVEIPPKKGWKSEIIFNGFSKIGIIQTTLF